MADISTYLENKLLEHNLGATSWTMPTTVYTALYTVAPTSAGGGVEITGTNYVRIVTSWGSALNGSIVNAADIRFPAAGTAGSNWGTAVALGLLDSITNGNLLYFGPLSATITINTGDDFRLAAGGLTVSLS